MAFHAVDVALHTAAALLTWRLFMALGVALLPAFGGRRPIAALAIGVYFVTLAPTLQVLGRPPVLFGESLPLRRRLRAVMR